MKALDFYYEFASTYSYLTVMRIEAAARAAGVEVNWRPFLSGPIFNEQGLKDSPFNILPAKGRYMWRDLERRSELYGLAFTKPSAFPRNGLKAARIATFLDNKRRAAFSKAVFQANFERDHDIAEHAVLSEALQQVDCQPEDVLRQAETQEVKDQLRAVTAQAAKLGIFGAPTFVVREEIFWGDDRLEDALAFASR